MVGGRSLAVLGSKAGEGACKVNFFEWRCELEEHSRENAKVLGQGVDLAHV